MNLTGIPVTFEYKGKEYRGTLGQVTGAATGGSFDLSVNGYHWGQLSYIQGQPGFKGGLHAVEAGWRFNSNQHPELSEQAEFFGYVITAWLDSHEFENDGILKFENG